MYRLFFFLFFFCFLVLHFLFNKLYCEFVPIICAARDVRYTGYSCHLCLYLFKFICFVHQTTSAYSMTGLIKEK